MFYQYDSNSSSRFNLVTAVDHRVRDQIFALIAVALPHLFSCSTATDIAMTAHATTASIPLGSRRSGTSSADLNESTDISVESSVPSDGGSDVIKCGASLPSTKTDRSSVNQRDFDRIYHDRSERSFKEPEQNAQRTPVRRRSNRWISVVVGMTVLIGAGIGIYFYLHAKDISLSQQNESSIESPNSQKISLAELNAHNDPTSDCWVSFHNTVYDVTTFALTHPGGSDLILSHCGKNATRAFVQQHPKSYLKDLSSDTVMGVLKNSRTTNQSNQTNTQTTEDDSKPTSNPVEKENDEGDDDGNGCGTGTGSTTAAPTVADTPTFEPTPASTCISATEVALHASRDDCWYILYNQVYDFTDYIDLHPGGARYVFQECGTDATSVYVNERKHDRNLLIEVDAPNLYLLADAC